MRTCTTLLGFAAITLVPLSSLAADYFVTQDGAGDGSGSSYGDAMGVAEHNARSFAPGDRILLCGDLSTTVEPQSSGTAADPIVYSGACDPDGDPSNGVEHPGHIDRGTLYGANIFGVAIRGQTHLVVEDLEVSFCSDGIYAAGGASHITVRRCTIHDCAYRGVWFGNNGGACTDVVVGGAPGEGNEIYDNAWGTAGGDVVTSGGTERLLVSYNRLYGKTAGRGIDGVVVHQTTGLTVEYNQIFDHDDDENADPAGEDYHPRSGRGEDGIDLKEGSSQVVIRFNDIWGHPYQTGITAQLGSHDVEIYGNRIRDNRVGIMMMAGNDETWGQRVHDVRIWSNLIHGNESNGVRALTSSVSQQPVDDVTIIGNVLAGNGYDDTYEVGEANDTGLALLSGSGHVVANNLLHGNSGWISSDEKGPYKQVHVGDGQAGQITFDHNGYHWPEHPGESIFHWGAAGDLSLAEVQAGDQAGLPQEANGWEADPGFVDAEQHDYALREDAAARDVGDSSVGSAFAYGLGSGTDFDRVLEGAAAILWVPRGEPWDCGAYEYVVQTEATCEDMGGSCCRPDEVCAGGESQPWDACGGGCCVGGACVPSGEGGGGAGGGGGGTATPAGAMPADEAGCGCRVTARAPGRSGLAAASLLLLAVATRLRRRPSRRGSPGGPALPSMRCVPPGAVGDLRLPWLLGALLACVATGCGGQSEPSLGAAGEAGLGAQAGMGGGGGAAGGTGQGGAVGDGGSGGSAGGLGTEGLIFRSGFEAGVSVKTLNAYSQVLDGSDATGDEWVEDLPGEATEDRTRYNFVIDPQAVSAPLSDFVEVALVDASEIPPKAGNRCIKHWTKTFTVTAPPTGMTRVQFNVYPEGDTHPDDLSRFYVEHWVYWPQYSQELLTAADSGWWMFAEFPNAGDGQVGLYFAYREVQGPDPYLTLKVDGTHVVNVPDVSPPVDQWFKLGYLFDRERGIAVYVDDVLVIDYAHVFPRPPNPMMIMKVYGGSGGLGYLTYWDELRWYEELPTALEQPFGG